MAFPSRILGAGNSPLSSSTICGDGATGLVALGTTAATALQLSAVFNAITSSTINAAATSLSVATAKTVLLFATSATTWASVTTA